MSEDAENQHGGKRDGAGRPLGSTNRRTVALREAIEAEGVEPAVALVRIAKAAEDRKDFGLAVEAYGKVLPFLHSRPKPTEADPDALVDLERRLIRAKIEETADVVSRPGIADRLARAKARVRLADGDAGGVSIEIGAEDAGPIIDVAPSRSAASAGPAASRPVPTPKAEAQPVAYRPVLPRPAMPAPIGDWSMPERQAFADEGRSSYDTDPYSAHPLGFLANRDC